MRDLGSPQTVCSAAIGATALGSLSLLLNHNIVADLIGIAVGHVYFFLEDVLAGPRATGGMGGPRLLKTPALIEWLFAADGGEEANYVIPEERAGGLGSSALGQRGGPSGLR